MNTLRFVVIVFALVVFRVSLRADSASRRGYKTWPILALLAVIYTALAIGRLLMGVHGSIFIIASLVCILLSQVLYRVGRPAL